MGDQDAISMCTLGLHHTAWHAYKISLIVGTRFNLCVQELLTKHSGDVYTPGAYTTSTIMYMYIPHVIFVPTIFSPRMHIAGRPEPRLHVHYL